MTLPRLCRGTRETAVARREFTLLDAEESLVEFPSASLLAFFGGEVQARCILQHV